ncbi:MAG: tRNA epoxyqueuosine(34) reductase QueG [Candidatus Eisenbacteria bacterium]|nr:tRNA epoxyqueuosine(34) reductase QueG [Candidatus Eisenbacteria bacterium]MCC7142888.1 tRNA epoxyqueuosine(34) reductase QueG [Candidatus Eisenbacteria bacterium]
MSGPPGTPLAWRDWIRSRGLEIGFTSVGIAAAREPDAARERLLSWLLRGDHAGMAWMAREPERRADPEAILPGCRAVISVSLQYHHPDPVPLAPGLPKVSRYAWGDDYHQVVGEKLHALLAEVQRLRPDVRSRIACDTSPVMDKAFAAAAGLGWIGKNTCLIHPRQGSWFFLGSLFVDLEIASDPPVRDLCGSCRRCLDACPTGAFPAPYQLDARRCIAYWNIEHRGDLPEPWPAAIGEWMVGCDICQDVCPWNRKALPSTEPRFRPRPGLADLPAVRWLEFDDAEIRRRIRPTAVSRIKPPDLRRNARQVERNRSANLPAAGGEDRGGANES